MDPIEAIESPPELGDSRLSARYIRIVERAACQPDASFPNMLCTSAELEGAYRFFSHDKVSFSKLLAPHIESTTTRCAELTEVIVAHDTTELHFKELPYEEASREGLGHLSGKGQGFYLHAAIALTAGVQTAPLGIVAAEAWARTPKKATGADQAVHRWERLASVASERLKSRIVHVMDREADIYSVFDSIRARDDGFVIRVRHNRRVSKPAESKLHDALIDLTPISKREIRISSRVAKGSQDRRRAYPTRKGRTAKVTIRAAAVEIARTETAKGSDTLCLNYLHLIELDPPSGEPAVDWKLLTTEPISNALEVERVVDIYRRFIEEFFKALKTGCAIEDRQLESLHALQNATALMIPIAWHLLAIRSASRHCPDAPAKIVFNDVQLEILRKLTDRPPPEDASLRQAMDALAALGGHIKNNGDPGWMVLGRGYQHLIKGEKVWRAATCDQS